MTTPKQLGQRSLAERFEDLDDEVPMTKEEAQTVLKAAGLDAADGMKRLLGELDAIEDKERAERFAKAEVAVRRERAQLEAKKKSDLARPELLEQLDWYRLQYPKLSAHFRNFQSASEEELRTLLAEIEELTGRGTKK